MSYGQTYGGGGNYGQSYGGGYSNTDYTTWYNNQYNGGQQSYSTTNYTPSGFGYSNFKSGVPIRDANGDGVITETDFINTSRQTGVSDKVAQSAFRKLDRNGNGYLDGQDIETANSYIHRLYY